MEESKNYGHQHPLALVNEDQLISDQERLWGNCNCYRCGGKVSAPYFCCVEEYCGFYLHKVCADAPSELNHPFHRDHPLVLMHKVPYLRGSFVCDFCYKTGNTFVYHCSCGLNLHTRCALFTYNIAENNLKELEYVALDHPLVSSKIKIDDVTKCFGCWEPLAKYAYFSPDCGFNLHKKCSELPLKLNRMCPRKHPLLLQFNSDRISCKICQETRRRYLGLVYVCSPCKFVVHIDCTSPVIEDKSHPHPFTLFWRRVPFTCDACGTEGNHAAYSCATCSIIVHKKCILLPRVIKSKWHDHSLVHKYFLYEEEFKTFDCIICHEKVNVGYGNYSCSRCNVIFHVNCVLKDEDSYLIVENEDEESVDISVNSITDVLEQNEAGEATVIQHFKHIHHLMLSDNVSEYENKCCDGCLLPVSDPFYHCLQCGFFLHKVCAELPKVKHVWHHRCRQQLVLTSNKVFQCVKCHYVSNAFAYKCEECNDYTCLRCIIALTPGAKICLGHKHPLLFYKDYGGQCNACGLYNGQGLFRCKECDLSLDLKCFSLPITVEDKCDGHLLSLTRHDNNSYSESHYCDICEESRDPKLWFYHCATCGTSAHVKCIHGDYPFMKLGSIYEENDHPHPLAVVKKRYHYPDCDECGKRCEDLALECTKSGCDYIVHWDCVAPYYLLWWWRP
ncbi:hypothetical protein GQ457_01G034720 [Hibiscus cannabinus]